MPLSRRQELFIKHPEWTATLYDVLSAYAAQRQKHALASVTTGPNVDVSITRDATVTVDSPATISTTAPAPEIVTETGASAAGAVVKGDGTSHGLRAVEARTGDGSLGRGSLEPGSIAPSDDATPPREQGPAAFAASAFDASAFQTGVEKPQRMRTAIGKSVQRNRSVIVVQVAALVTLIDDKIALLGNELHNDPDVIAARDEAIAHYESLKRALQALHSATVSIESGRGAETRAENATKSLVEGIRCWWDKDHVEICRATFKASLFMSCIGLCSLVGATAPAIAVSGALIGGKPVVEALKSVASGLRRAPERRPDKSPARRGRTR